MSDERDAPEHGDDVAAHGAADGSAESAPDLDADASDSEDADAPLGDDAAVGGTSWFLNQLTGGRNITPSPSEPSAYEPPLRGRSNFEPPAFTRSPTTDPAPTEPIRSAEPESESPETVHTPPVPLGADPAPERPVDATLPATTAMPIIPQPEAPQDPATDGPLRPRSRRAARADGAAGDEGGTPDTDVTDAFELFGIAPEVGEPAAADRASADDVLNGPTENTDGVPFFWGLVPDEGPDPLVAGSGREPGEQASGQPVSDLAAATEAGSTFEAAAPPPAASEPTAELPGAREPESAPEPEAVREPEAAREPQAASEHARPSRFAPLLSPDGVGAPTAQPWVPPIAPGVDSADASESAGEPGPPAAETVGEPTGFGGEPADTAGAAKASANTADASANTADASANTADASANTAGAPVNTAKAPADTADTAPASDVAAHGEAPARIFHDPDVPLATLFGFGDAAKGNGSAGSSSDKSSTDAAPVGAYHLADDTLWDSIIATKGGKPIGAHTQPISTVPDETPTALIPNTAFLDDDPEPAHDPASDRARHAPESADAATADAGEGAAAAFTGPAGPASATSQPPEAPAERAPAAQAPADQAPAERPPADQAPADQAPADSSPAGQPPAGLSAAAQPPVPPPASPASTDEAAAAAGAAEPEPVLDADRPVAAASATAPVGVEPDPSDVGQTPEDAAAPTMAFGLIPSEPSPHEAPPSWDDIFAPPVPPTERLDLPAVADPTPGDQTVAAADPTELVGYATGAIAVPTWGGMAPEPIEPALSAAEDGAGSSDDAPLLRPRVRDSATTGAGVGTAGSDDLDDAAPAASAQTPPSQPVAHATRRNSRAIVWTAIALAAVLVLIGLFVLGTRLPALFAAAPVASPTPTATPTPTPTPTVTPKPTAAQRPGVHAWYTLGGGECLQPYSSPWASTFKVVNCATPHTAQLLYTGLLSTNIADPYPGASALASQMNVLCSAPGIVNLQAAQAYPDLQVQGTYPADASQWASGQRSYYCFATRSSGQPITGSIAGPGPAS